MPAVAEQPAKTKRKASKPNPSHDLFKLHAREMAQRAAAARKANRLREQQSAVAQINPEAIPAAEVSGPPVLAAAVTATVNIPGRSESECNVLSGMSMRVRERLGVILSKQIEALGRQRLWNAPELANKPERQGKAAVLRTLVDAAKDIFGWGEHDRPAGTISVERLPSSTPSVVSEVLSVKGANERLDCGQQPAAQVLDVQATAQPVSQAPTPSPELAPAPATPSAPAQPSPFLAPMPDRPPGGGG